MKPTLSSPYIPASANLPESTLKSVILGVVLAIVLAGSNAYLGLKMGMTIAASIPAAVISMAVLRAFRQSNILENNIVQTIASAGEVVAAGIIFTIPALLVMGFWTEFHYWQITVIGIVGGILGILFSIPLRRALIIEENLKFPEGVAAAEVLKAGEARETGGAKNLIIGALSAASIKFAQTGLHIFSESIKGWVSFGTSIFSFSGALSLSMVSAGYIVGVGIALNILGGIVLAWLIIVPLYTGFCSPQEFGLSADASALDFAAAVRGAKLRYIGVGAFIIGGLWTLISLVKPIRSAVSSSFDAMRKSRLGQSIVVIRTEKDISMTTVLLSIAILIIPIFLLFKSVMESANLSISSGLWWFSIIFSVILVVVIGFITSSIAGYIAGLVGSSSSPLSALTIAAILTVSLSLLAILGTQIDFVASASQALSMAAVAIIISSVICVATAVSCDNMQDLKTGHVLGATPWKQQVTLMIGVVAGALVVSPILELLYEAYGIGGAFPRPGMDPANSLSAPQATLMASVAKGIFARNMDWPPVLIGVGIGITVVSLDQILRVSGSVARLSLLAIALGIYLPMDITIALVIGGLISYLAKRKIQNSKSSSTAKHPDVATKAERSGLLLASGMIAGDALIGIILAIPFAAYQSTEVLAIVDSSFEQYALILGTLAVGFVTYYLYKQASNTAAT